MTALHPALPIRYVYRVQQSASDSWWVYKYDLGNRGSLSNCQRVVFFGRSLAQVDQWLSDKRHEGFVMDRVAGEQA